MAGGDAADTGSAPDRGDRGGAPAGHVGGDRLRRIHGLPEHLAGCARALGRRCYSVYALGLDAGLSERVASDASFAVAGGLLASSVVLGRRGDDRGSFILAIAAALAFSPSSGGITSPC